ncbi:HAD family hydrolase [Bacillus sp. V59.32b]|uniref:HAD family hydrolase n=1 Tax=Bacillus sp. V59.32b TaxID=1758642 RepID=UPI000E3EB5E8|nr:HAD-IA family hydrolase [Bacillus sp. V59.32b]RFU60142.1 HAD family hydrolase [Bacillus sp. V59.32b]
MIKAVLFDLDGTLLNRDASVKKFIDNQYDRLNKWVAHLKKDEYSSRFIELDCRGYVWKDKVYREMVREYDIQGLTWEMLLQDYLNHFKSSCIGFPNLIEMLNELKSNSLLLGMITNGKGQFQMDNIQALEIKDYFDSILISEWEGIKKPDAEIFERAMRKLNVSAEECLFVGDHPENDVKAAQNAGINAIWKEDKQWTNVQADYIINDLMEVPFIIKNV